MGDKADKSAATPRRRRGSTPSLAAGEHTVDQLARAAGTTVRNVRAYQDRGILPAPEKRGRQAIYDTEHLERLRIIDQLLDRGYTISSIKELLDAAEEGRNITEVIGLASAITSRFTTEKPQSYSMPQLLKMFGFKSMRQPLLKRTIQLGLLQPKGARFICPTPRLLEAGAQMVQAGLKLDNLLDIIEQLRSNVERAANGIVKLIVDELDQYGDDLPPQSEVSRLSDLIWQIRPLAHVAIQAEAYRALDRATNEFFDDRVRRIIGSLQQHRGSEEFEGLSVD